MQSLRDRSVHVVVYHIGATIGNLIDALRQCAVAIGEGKQNIASLGRKIGNF